MIRSKRFALFAAALGLALQAHAQSGLFLPNGQSLGNADSRGAALADLDGDGDKDAFVANTNGTGCQVYFNNGSGQFTDGGQRLGDGDFQCVALADLDGDKDLDAFVTNYNGPCLVFLNNGKGVFANSGQELGDDPSMDVALGDLDGDGDKDAFVANYGAPCLVYLNNGKGKFTAYASVGDAKSRGVALGDLDKDGDLDAYVANDGADKVFLNDGEANFTATAQALGTFNSRRVALGDLDGDKDLDAFVVNADNQPCKVWLNDGKAKFSTNGQSLGDSSCFGVALGDFDADGDLDAYVAVKYNVAGNPGANLVYLNNGAALFYDSGQTLGASTSADAATADLDGDGALDVFVANTDVIRPNIVYLNQPSGAGIFVHTAQALGSGTTHAVALGDLDGDAKPDAFTANANGCKVYLGQGGGTFADSGQTLGKLNGYGAALGDLDGDGDLDAFVANFQDTNGNPQPAKVYFNDGKGNFTDSGQNLVTPFSSSVTLGDFDGDGDLDAFIAYCYDSGGYPGGNQVWINDGDGLFSDSLQMLGQSVSTAVALGDFNDDGNFDAFVGNSGPNTVWMDQAPLRNYIINAIAGANGKVTPAGKVVVKKGGSQQFAITPDKGYLVADVKVDGASVGAVTTYTFSAVVADHTLSASFAVETLGVSASAGPGGSISPSGLVPINAGASLTFTITPDSSHYVYDLVVDGASAGAFTQYTFKKIAVNHTIAAQFTAQATPVTFDSVVTVAAADLGLGSFTKKPSAYFTCMSSNGKISNKALKVLTASYPAAAITCQWNKAAAPGAYSLWVKPAGQKAGIHVKAVFTVMSPELASATPDSGKYPANVTLAGRYWGDKSVKVCVYYPDAKGKTKKANGKISTLAFDPVTNVGQIVFALPKPLEKLAAGTVVQLSALNKIGESPKLPFTLE